MSTHTPRTSAAMAAPTFNGTAILLIVTHFFSVNPFDHDFAAAPAIVFEASMPETTGSSFQKISIFFSLCSNVGPVVCFLIMFLVDVLHEVVDVRDRCGCTSLLA